MAIGIAVIGAGMAGRAHAAAYRIAPTLYQSTLPPVPLVSTKALALISKYFGDDMARSVKSSKIDGHNGP